MNDQERQLTISAFVKWINGEPMSTHDLRRIIETFDTKPLGLDQATPDVVAGLQARIRSVLQAKFLQ